MINIKKGKKIEKKVNILENIKDPKDLKELSADEIRALCSEIRSVLIEGVSENGGHLASNLGVVELSVAIHRVFDSPKDHIIFDVGHQSYVHKLLTGRKNAFSTLRRAGGLSGFPKRSESVHDAFGTGHSSTSLSAGLGFAEADKLIGSDAYTVVVLGDGAFTGGMIHEAINNCKRGLKLILIINENEMSISKNTGLFARHLSRLRVSPGYYKTKTALERFLEHLPLIGKPIYRFLGFIKRKFKALFYSSNYFEQMGFSYFGPADGNNAEVVEDYLRAAKARGKSCVVHLKTVKGKGYDLAEKKPDSYHGIQPKNKEIIENSFSSAMGEKLTEIAKKDDRVCAITAAMMQGTGLTPFKESYPKRFFDVGIAESHAVTFAAGLSASGRLPVVAIYSTFLQRAYDNIIHDVALQDLPVVFCVDRAGLNPSDGATHHGIFDVAFLSQVPKMEIWEPVSYSSLNRIFDAYFENKKRYALAIRYPSGSEDKDIISHFAHGKIAKITEGVYADFDLSSVPENIIITYGRLTNEAIRAQADSDKQVGIILLEKLSGLDDLASALSGILRGKNIIFAEEGVYSGSVSTLLASRLVELGTYAKISILAIKDDFVVQSVDEHIFKTAGIDADSIKSRLI